MKSLIILSTLVLSLSSFAQDIINCFDSSNIVDGGFGFSLSQTTSGLSAEVTEMTIAGPMTIAKIENTTVYRTDYSKLSPSLDACSLAVIGKQKTEFGHKVVRVNIFQDGFVGMRTQEYVIGYLYCSYLQSKNSDTICTPGGSDKLILVNEFVQTTSNLAYVFEGSNNDVRYSQIECVENDFSMFVTDNLKCDNQKTISVKIDL